jgi:hypothetical protein
LGILGQKLGLGRFFLDAVCLIRREVIFDFEEFEFKGVGVIAQIIWILQFQAILIVKNFKKVFCLSGSLLRAAMLLIWNGS